MRARMFKHTIILLEQNRVLVATLSDFDYRGIALPCIDGLGEGCDTIAYKVRHGFWNLQ